MSLAQLATEQRNATTTRIDVVSTLEMCQMINREDQQVAHAVALCLPDIARAIDGIVPRLQRGGRVVYLGAGTSGRLGVLDASEIAIQHAVENAEDSTAAPIEDLLALDPPLSHEDTVVGLAASGRTPYVLAAIRFARQRGLFTVGICCSTHDMGADVVINALVGPEVVTGSTRMKSGTAQKMILNMLSTGCQVRLGKTYGNLMVDVKPSNDKLRDRARRIFREVLAGYTTRSWGDVEIDELLRCGSVKLAILAGRWGCSTDEAATKLDAEAGILRAALDSAS